MFKKFAQGKMGDGWNNKRLYLLYKRDADRSRPLQELIDDVPGRVPPDAWDRYVRWRRGELGKKRSKQGVYSRSHQNVHHTTGKKPFSVGYREMRMKLRRKGRRLQRPFLLPETQAH